MNFNDDLIFDFLEYMGYNLPAVIAMMVGGLLTAANRHRHPSAVRWGVLGFWWLFVTAVVSIAWRTIGVALVFADNPPMSLGEVLSYWFLSGCEAFGYICFIVALSAMHKPYRPYHYHEDFGDEPERVAK